jgi:poly-gamma-glutamate synthesis protein (capsule biosynthesis protein)
MKRGPVALVIGILVLAIVIPVSGGMLGGPAPSSTSSADAGRRSPTPTSAPTPTGPSTSPAGSPSAPSASPAGSLAPLPSQPAPSHPAAGPRTLKATAIVPVTDFRSAESGVSRAEVLAILSGESDRYGALELVRSEANAILTALEIEPSAVRAGRLIRAGSAAAVARDLAAHRDRLAFLRADAVMPKVRALAWGHDSLFGVGRVSSLTDWPLRATLPDRPGRRYDPARAWTLVAGGDILLDRGVAKTVKFDGRGVDFPFDGGRAEITSRYCCSSFGWELPITARTGGAGAMRRLLSSADLAIANFENPAPDAFSFHASGTSFSADPALIEGLRNAGIDWVSLANNHIGDAGDSGILDTMRNLRDWRIRHGGAGRDVRAATRPSILSAGTINVGILAFDDIAGVYAASHDEAGSAHLSKSACRSGVRAARRAGADIVIVFPHWGTEYDPTPFAGQQDVARACLDAGADMIIGNHAHWAGAMEVYDGKPIWYALGNFVFDQTWSELTMEGITLELTFEGAELRQVRMRPHIILDKAQPNFLDPADDGRVVMGQIFDASAGLLPW